MIFTAEFYDDAERWLEARRGSLGSSDAVGLLGIPVDGRDPRGFWWQWVYRNLNAWGSMSDAAKDRYREIDEKWQQSINVSARRAMEPVIQEWASEQEGLVLSDPGDCILRSVEDPRRHVSPDLLVFAQPPLDFDLTDLMTGAECKTVSPFARRHWTDEPSEYALLQTIWAMDVTGWDQHWVFAQIGYGDQERERLSYLVDRNEELAAMLRDAAERFWEYVDKDKEPPVDGLPHTTWAIRLLHESRPKGGKSIILPGRFTALEVERRRLDAEVKQRKRRIEQIRQEVELVMTGEEGVTDAAVPLGEGLDETTTYRRQKVLGKTDTCGYCKGTGTRTTKDQTRLQATKG